MSEVVRYLDGLLTFCKDEIEKLAQERENVMYHEMEPVQLPIPQTTFNQPFINGTFTDKPIIKLEANIRLGQNIKTLSSINPKDITDILATLVIATKEPNDLRDSLFHPQIIPADDANYGLVSDKISAVFKNYCETKIMGNFGDTVCEFVNNQRDGNDFDIKQILDMANINGKLHDSYVVQDKFVRTKGTIDSLRGLEYRLTDDDCCPLHIFFTRLYRMHNFSTRFIIGDEPSPLKPSFACHLLAGAIRKSGGKVDMAQLDENEIRNIIKLLSL